MNSTKLLVTALLGFIINVASAQNYNAGLGYASDYFYRGALKVRRSLFKHLFGAQNRAWRALMFLQELLLIKLSMAVLIRMN